MATTRKTKNPVKTGKSNKNEETLLEQFLTELDREIDAQEAGVKRKITKGQALIKSMVNEALKGDQRMMANVLKFIEKLDKLQAAKKEDKKEDANGVEMGPADWSLAFDFFARNRPYVELELDHRKKENPATFDLKWEPVKLEDAPWRQWAKDK
jgi:hypothetical protein